MIGLQLRLSSPPVSQTGFSIPRTGRSLIASSVSKIHLQKYPSLKLYFFDPLLNSNSAQPQQRNALTAQQQVSTPAAQSHAYMHMRQMHHRNQILL